MPDTVGYAAEDAKSPLAPFTFSRRDTGPTDVRIDILFCGVCHSDLHQARNEWGISMYPVVPGHEIVGRVAEVGAEVTTHKVGDLVGVGCLVDSCRACESCKEGLEQYCLKEATQTYNSEDKVSGGHTFGGYSKSVTVVQDFVLKIPEGMDPAGAAPLLCAGITTFSPLRHWKVGKGTKVGIVGLGGLGHMGVKLAAAMGAEVTLFTTSPGKEADARRLGAAHVVVSRDEAAMGAEAGQYDFILDTVAAEHDLAPYLNCLKRDGTMTLVGAPEKPTPLHSFSLIPMRRTLAGSMIGGIPETQEMLDFCGQHGLTADIEIIPMDGVNAAYERMLKSDVKYRFVIDMSTLAA